MRRGSSEEQSADQTFKVFAAKFLILQFVFPLVIAIALSSVISLKTSLPLIGGFFLGIGFLVFLQLFKSSFEVKEGKLKIKAVAKITDFSLTSLIVESDTALGPFKVQDITFRDKYTSLTSMKLGSARFLSAEGMLLLAALQRHGAFIDVIGFGTYTRGPIFNRQTAVPTMIGADIVFLVFGGYSLLMNGMILYFRFLDQQETLGRSTLLDTFFTPIGIQAFFILSAAWICLAIFIVIRAVEAKRGIFPIAIELSEDNVKLMKRTKEVFDLKLNEIKLVRVTAHEKRISRDLISVELETHYARKYKIVDRGIIVPIGVSNFLEHARRKGVTVVYQKLSKGADVPEVIWGAKSEKSAPPFDSGKDLYESPDDKQIRQTEG